MRKNNKETAMSKPQMPYTQIDGNIFSILGNARRAMREQGSTREEIAQFDAEVEAAKLPGSGVDYYGMIGICLKYVEDGDPKASEDEEEDNFEEDEEDEIEDW
jgi:hypothetical protein